MDIDLQLKQTQRLMLTQALRQSLVLLQMPLQELGPYINELAMSNPMLDVEYSPLVAVSLDHISDAEKKQSMLDELISVNENDPESGSIRSSIGYSDSYSSFFDGLYTAAAHGSNKYYEGTAADYTSYLTKPQTFSEYLHGQLGMRANIEEPYLSLCSYLIDCLSSSGYLDISTGELAAELNTSEENVEEALFTLQSLDPAGVGARSLSECLMLQLNDADGVLKSMPADPDTVIRLIMTELPLLAARDFKALAKALEVSPAEAKAAARFVYSLNPIPSRGFYADSSNAVIIPDAYVYVSDGIIHIELNKQSFPKIGINSYYKSLMAQGTDPSTKSYLRTCLGEAKDVMAGISNRESTLQAILTCIAGHQESFFINGGQLEPLTRSELSAELGFSNSTISRAVRNKYLQFDKKIYPLDSFFTNAVSISSGQSISARAVQEQLKRMIKEEDSARPLSDSRIVERLTALGIDVSRRTIAKYRFELGIPSASGRRRA